MHNVYINLIILLAIVLLVDVNVMENITCLVFIIILQDIDHLVSIIYVILGLNGILFHLLHLHFRYRIFGGYLIRNQLRRRDREGWLININKSLCQGSWISMFVIASQDPTVGLLSLCSRSSLPVHKDDTLFVAHFRCVNGWLSDNC